MSKHTGRPEGSDAGTPDTIRGAREDHTTDVGDTCDEMGHVVTTEEEMWLQAGADRAYRHVVQVLRSNAAWYFNSTAGAVGINRMLSRLADSIEEFVGKPPPEQG